MNEPTTKSSNKLLALLLAAVLIGGGLLLVARALQGTAPTYNARVNGTVTIDGQLASSGVVTFHPASGGGPVTGSIHSNGTYALRSGQGNLKDVDGGTIPAGGYVVTVSINAPSPDGQASPEGGPPRPGPSLIASRYARMDTSDLKYVVEPGENVIVLNLDGPTDEALEESTEGEAADEAGSAESDEASAPTETEAETLSVSQEDAQ